MIPDRVDVDLLVIGGGPAGLAVAVGARRQGLRVMVADCARPPINKACGEGLMPDGLRALRELGFQVGSASSFPFRGIRFVERDIRVEASFPSGCGLGVCRTALHQAMVATAEDAGVWLQWGTPVTGISPDGSAVLAGRRITARWIIGADGLHSRVRSWAGLGARDGGARRFGFRRHYRLAPWADCMELYWGHNGQLYVTPVSPQEVCVVGLSRDPRWRLEHALAEFPDVQARLGAGGQSAPGAGAVTVLRRLPRVTRGPVALIGDASGSVDAITGEGLCLAFRQARALVEALEHGDLSLYEAAHRRLMWRPALMSALLLSFESRPRLRRSLLTVLAKHPALFREMLAAHVGALSPVGFALNGLAVGCRMLAGGSILMRRSS